MAVLITRAHSLPLVLEASRKPCPRKRWRVTLTSLLVPQLLKQNRRGKCLRKLGPAWSTRRTPLLQLVRTTTTLGPGLESIASRVRTILPLKLPALRPAATRAQVLLTKSMFFWVLLTVRSTRPLALLTHLFISPAWYALTARLSESSFTRRHSRLTSPVIAAPFALGPFKNSTRRWPLSLALSFNLTCCPTKVVTTWVLRKLLPRWASFITLRRVRLVLDGTPLLGRGSLLLARGSGRLLLNGKGRLLIGKVLSGLLALVPLGAQTAPLLAKTWSTVASYSCNRQASLTALQKTKTGLEEIPRLTRPFNRLSRPDLRWAHLPQGILISIIPWALTPLRRIPYRRELLSNLRREKRP